MRVSAVKKSLPRCSLVFNSPQSVLHLQMEEEFYHAVEGVGHLMTADYSARFEFAAHQEKLHNGVNDPPVILFWL
jgi:hypothetical protein